MAHTKEQFTQAENNWDLENLYTDLASAKGKNLTLVEKRHLRGLLCGYSPVEIAQVLHKTSRGLEVDLSNTLYQYVKTIVDRLDEKVENWRNICQWLEDAGYKYQPAATQSQLSNSVPVDAKVHISNINFEGDKIEIGILLQLPIPSPSDSSNKKPAQ
ncbi:MAG: helix-turn-helix domain-containing protein [Pseudomonadota bacterium]